MLGDGGLEIKRLGTSVYGVPLLVDVLRCGRERLIRAGEVQLLEVGKRHERDVEALCATPPSRRNDTPVIRSLPASHQMTALTRGRRPSEPLPQA